MVVELHDEKVLSNWLNQALQELSSRERMIILKRRLTEDGATLEELGRVLGVSKERVRQLEHRALKKLKKSLEEKHDSPLELISQIS